MDNSSLDHKSRWGPRCPKRFEAGPCLPLQEEALRAVRRGPRKGQMAITERLGTFLNWAILILKKSLPSARFQLGQNRFQDCGIGILVAAWKNGL